MSVSRLNCIQLASFLASKGLSDVGQKSITEKEIPGEMLLEFCEDDIQDAFTIFKDRFIIRKVLRDQKSLENGSQSSSPSTNSAQRKLSSPESNLSHFRTQQSFESFKQKNSPAHSPSHSSIGGSQGDRIPIRNQDQSIRGVISLDNTCSEKVIPLKIHPNQNSSPIGHSSQSSSNYVRQTVRRQSNELMNARVSSTDEYRNAIRIDDSPVNVYDSAIDALVSLSSQHAMPSKTNHSKCTVTSETESRPERQTNTQAMPKPTTLNENHQLPSASSIYGLNYDCTYAWNIMSMKVKSYSADDLLSKRNRFGKPSEGQRLGGILIRNAAHAAGLWKDAPCMHEISLAQKKEFYKFVVGIAPQLGANQSVLFVRLREALQNRRKYLLDKKLGKVDARRKRPPGNMSIEIADTGELVDLSDIGDEVDMDSDDVLIKTEEMIKTEKH